MIETTHTSRLSADAVPRWQRVAWWLILLAYLALLLTATHIPHPPVQKIPLYNDKVLHFLAYFGVGFLLGLRTIRTWQRGAGFLLIILAIAAVDELTQPYFRRTTELYDWLSDGAGGLCGMLLGTALRQLARRWWINVPTHAVPRTSTLDAPHHAGERLAATAQRVGPGSIR